MDEFERMLGINGYGELFEPSHDSIKEKYLELAKIYHPDSCDDDRAAEVFAHINELREEAVSQIDAGIWKKPGRISLEMKRGGWISVDYISETEFELGRAYIARDKILYLIEKEHMEYYDNALSAVGNIRYENDNMREEFEEHLPNIIRQGITKAEAGMLIVRKNEDEYPLREVLGKLDNKMEPRHVAWIISRLCSICCYLQYLGLVHNGLTVDNLFINPKSHKVSLLGGWWYVVLEGKKMVGTTAEVFEQMSDRCKSTKLSEYRTDQEMVHEIAKILLDNKSLVFIKGEHTDIPDAMASWIRNGSSGCAFEEFENWNKTLDDSWGRRVFVDLIVPGID